MRSRTLNNTRHKQGGFAMISAMFLLMVAAMFGIALAGLSINGVRMADHRKDRSIAFDYAEAGLNHAIAELREYESYSGQAKTAFGEGWFEVKVYPVAGQPKYRQIVSQGTVGSGVAVVIGTGNGVGLTRTVTAIVDVSGQHQGIEYALFTGMHLEFTGNAVITSDPMPSLGDIHSNGTMYFSGDPYIDGQASSVDTVTYSGNPTFTGGMDLYADPIDFPVDVDEAALYAAASAIGTINGDVAVEDSQVRWLSGVITGKLTVKDNAQIIVDGPLYVMGEVILQGRNVIPGEIGGTLITPERVTVGGYGGYDFDPLIHNNLKIISMKGPEDVVAIDFSGDTAMKAAFIAPNGRVNVSGKLDIWGQLLAQVVYLSGEMNVRRNTNFEAGPTEEAQVTVESWQEKHPSQ